jgi:hypothetical protein
MKLIVSEGKSNWNKWKVIHNLPSNKSQLIINNTIGCITFLTSQCVTRSGGINSQHRNIVTLSLTAWYIDTYQPSCLNAITNDALYKSTICFSLYVDIFQKLKMAIIFILAALRNSNPTFQQLLINSDLLLNEWMDGQMDRYMYDLKELGNNKTSVSSLITGWKLTENSFYQNRIPDENFPVPASYINWWETEWRLTGRMFCRWTEFGRCTDTKRNYSYLPPFPPGSLFCKKMLIRCDDSWRHTPLRKWLTSAIISHQLCSCLIVMEPRVRSINLNISVSS